MTQIDELSAQFDEIEDEYLRERKADIQQVAERVLKVLMGTAQLAVPRRPDDEYQPQMIVVAHDISPADMLQFRDRSFIGFVTDVGGQNSHTAIVARSLDIPAAVGMSQASQLIEQDDWVIIDGDAGVVIANPSPLVLEQYRARQIVLQKTRKKLLKLKKTPAVTLDGTKITLLANIELPEDCGPALEAGANGVGLFRSEFLFMGRGGHAHMMPSEEEQFEQYKKAVVAMKGRPVMIRTLDIGADKPLDQSEHTALNPGAGPARDPLLPGRAAAVPDPVARDPARVRLRQGAHADPDAGACLRNRPDPGHGRAGQGAAARSRRQVRRRHRRRRHDRNPRRRAGAAHVRASAWISCRSAPTT